MPSLLGQIGIGVTNIQTSLEFYTTTLSIGLEQTQEFDTPDFKEIVLSFPRGGPSSEKSGSGAAAAAATGSEIALMQYKDKTLAPPTNQQGKLLFFVDDVEEVMERCKEAQNCEIYSDVGEGEGVLEYIGIVKDPDGFLVEFVPYMFLQAAQGGSKM